MTQYKDFQIIEARGKYIVLAKDGEKLSSPLESVERAQRFIDAHIRRGGK